MTQGIAQLRYMFDTHSVLGEGNVVNAYQFYRNIYKESAGGVCIHIKVNNVWVDGDDLPSRLSVDVIEALQISCIIEGSDAEFSSDVMEIDTKFDYKTFTSSLDDVEDLVEEYYTQEFGDMDSIPNF
jgi:hypothetical protein